MIGVYMITILVPTGVMTLAAFIIELSQKANRWSRKIRVLSLAATGLSCFIISVLSWIYMLKPATVYDYDDDQQNTLENDALLVLIGGFIMLTFTPFTLVCCYLAVWHYSAPSHPTALVIKKPDFAEPLTASAWRDNWKPIAGLFVLLLVWAFSTAAFSSVWNYSAHSYFGAQSEYAIIHYKVNYHFYFKMYQDSIVFFVFMAVVILLGVAVHFNQTFQRFMHTRFKVPGMAQYIPTGMAYGETGLLLMFAGLVAYWLWFWRWGYARIKIESGVLTGLANSCCHNTTAGSDCSLPADEHALLQIWARVMGHMTTLFMSFLILPVARNSVWEYVYGIPFERAIKYHRVLGVAVWSLVTVHMLLWMIKWLKDGTLINNIATLDYLQITPTNIHFDNFTIMLTETAWLMLTIMVGLALWTRRSHYEIFYYSHYIGIFFFIVAIIHAWSFWYYAIGGLMLWLYDRCLRIVSGATPVELKRAYYDHDAGVTVLEWAKPGFKHKAGQYAWIAVPCLSHLEWHPFTISSHPSNNVDSFHIKVMGPNTWTERLAQAVEQRPQDISLRVDGPYGRPLYFDQCRHLLLVAGGIGITPLYSILSELCARRMAGESTGTVQKVTLVWCVRQPALFHTFSQMLMASARMSDFFDIKLHYTCSSDIGAFGEAPEEANEQQRLEFITACVQLGRPDLFNLASALPANRDTMLMACGPETMINAASDVAFEYDFSFHHEVFHF